MVEGVSSELTGVATKEGVFFLLPPLTGVSTCPSASLEVAWNKKGLEKDTIVQEAESGRVLTFSERLDSGELVLALLLVLPATTISGAYRKR